MFNQVDQAVFVSGKKKKKPEECKYKAEKHTEATRSN